MAAWSMSGCKRLARATPARACAANWCASCTWENHAATTSQRACICRIAPCSAAFWPKTATLRSSSVAPSDDETQLARQYLSDAHRSLGEVADLLGFADQSNLFRACRRWFGMPPGQYRAQLPTQGQPQHPPG